ncbi:MAG: hypothetical protein COA88_02175 [Kordia sp.]|nr:MAG: hypothetical protein COA88_02175 [Kordia sp.]
MVVINREKLVDIYNSILNGELSYPNADRWAWKMMENYDNNELIFEPNEEEPLLWELIQYLYGIDMPSMSDRTKTARTNEDIKYFLKEIDFEIE